MRVDAVDAGDGAQQPGLEESSPFVHQAPVASHVILHKHTTQIIIILKKV